MSSIKLRDLSVRFRDGSFGLQNINLSIESEEFVVLIGPSGSGKTTMLRTIAGFVEPTSGSVHIGGDNMTHVPPEQRRMGMVFQQHAVWPHMSVAKNIGYPLVRNGEKKASISKRVERVLDLVGLEGFGSRKPASLSGGQRQRVALARAIIADPTVLLLDEALSALDEPLRDALRRELVSLTRREGLTTVHVTHDRAEAISIADRIVVLGGGNIQQIATPTELLSAPATADVARFIADATVLTGTIQHGKVVCSDLGISWDLGAVQAIDDVIEGESVDIAIPPQSVSIGPAHHPDYIFAEITSVLFQVTSYSITAKTHTGHSFRTSISCSIPVIGETIGLSVENPLVYRTFDQDRSRGTVSWSPD
ncbi:ABC transporter ATP-binding protein [Corynebacterium crudilactis]|uniref:Trehalose import ATP-binding protein SugC n=1 Tax=Corynebacterium crudilactis TaxID=1652495 RepID=A0A172QR56_9CORY|nr:ABC transporter ATP-binding protein [Corynebacterium crudilactis]ANE03140.1 Fe3+/spermidine/putrescine ABC transporter ATP-binding protein [Corynebacterium crudilactis]